MTSSLAPSLSTEHSVRNDENNGRHPPSPREVDILLRRAASNRQAPNKWTSCGKIAIPEAADPVWSAEHEQVQQQEARGSNPAGWICCHFDATPMSICLHSIRSRRSKPILLGTERPCLPWLDGWHGGDETATKWEQQNMARITLSPGSMSIRTGSLLGIGFERKMDEEGSGDSVWEDGRSS